MNFSITFYNQPCDQLASTSPFNSFFHQLLRRRLLHLLHHTSRHAFLHLKFEIHHNALPFQPQPSSVLFIPSIWFSSAPSAPVCSIYFRCRDIPSITTSHYSHDDPLIVILPHLSFICPKSVIHHDTLHSHAWSSAFRFVCNIYFIYFRCRDVSFITRPHCSHNDSLVAILLPHLFSICPKATIHHDTSHPQSYSSTFRFVCSTCSICFQTSRHTMHHNASLFQPRPFRRHSFYSICSKIKIVVHTNIFTISFTPPLVSIQLQHLQHLPHISKRIRYQTTIHHDTSQSYLSTSSQCIHSIYSTSSKTHHISRPPPGGSSHSRFRFHTHNSSLSAPHLHLFLRRAPLRSLHPQNAQYLYTRGYSQVDLDQGGGISCFVFIIVGF